MSKFFLLSHGNGRGKRIVMASNKYEAIGFYLVEEVTYIISDDLDRVKVIQPETIFEVYVGDKKINKTLECIWKEKDDWIYPKTIFVYN